MTEVQNSATYLEIVERLQNKSEEELKLLYVKFFSGELIEEWKEITNEADFTNVKEEDIIKAIQKGRYNK